MSFIDTLSNIANTNESLMKLKYCLVNKDKLPYKIDGSLAKPNNENDFVSFETLIENIDNIKGDYKGVGISIQGNKVCAIDVDHCFEIPFDISSSDERAKNIIDLFKDKAYIEFSFSGTGLRVLFYSDVIENYSDLYYIKNSNNHIEYYQPSNSYRYVTVTGKYIYNNYIKHIDVDFIKNKLLDIYMKKEIRKFVVKTICDDNRSLEEIMRTVRFHYIKYPLFQDLWFAKAPGSGKDESEKDFHLITYLYENITQDKTMLKQVFESSPFYKSKDWKHVNKWKNQNNRYYNYLYSVISK